MFHSLHLWLKGAPPPASAAGSVRGFSAASVWRVQIPSSLWPSFDNKSGQHWEGQVVPAPHLVAKCNYRAGDACGHEAASKRRRASSPSPLGARVGTALSRIVCARAPPGAAPAGRPCSVGAWMASCLAWMRAAGPAWAPWLLAPLMKQGQGRASLFAPVFTGTCAQQRGPRRALSRRFVRAKFSGSTHCPSGTDGSVTAGAEERSGAAGLAPGGGGETFEAFGDLGGCTRDAGPSDVHRR